MMNAPALIEEGVRLHRAGRLAEAQALYRQALAAGPQQADALHLLGVIALQTGDAPAARDLLQQAVAQRADVAEFHLHLGVAWLRTGEPAEAIVAFETALRLQPDHAVVRDNLADARCQSALAHQNAGRDADAIRELQAGLGLRPDFPGALNALGVSWLRMGRAADAEAVLRRALALQGDVAAVHCNHGNALLALGRDEEAAAAYASACELAPDFAEARNNLGNTRARQERYDEALAHYQRAAELAPASAAIASNAANALKELGRLDAAIAAYRRIVQQWPDQVVAHSSLLLTLHYHPDISPADLAREHRAWAARHAARFRPPPVPARVIDRGRRLRVGYVSPDLCDHPVARFLRPLLEYHDRSRFEVFAYSGVPRPDAVTERLRRRVDAWRDIAWLTDEAAAGLVRRDEIDVLVDLAAHAAGGRPLLFARRPASVQVTYLAYCSTTGLETIDYRLSDSFFDPPGTDLSNYTEATERLPGTYWCYAPPEVEVATEAAATRPADGIVFGCLNNPCKVTEVTLRLWAETLRATPGSRFVLHARPGSPRENITGVFAATGVAPDRIRFVGRQPFAAYLAQYREIDIALDPFPFTGGTTTCDALWMGVPVVSLAGRTAVSRGGASLLSHLGLPELVASTPADYVRIAATLAADRVRLADLRGGLRTRFLASPLTDGRRFTRELEATFEAMWRRLGESSNS